MIMIIHFIYRAIFKIHIIKCLAVAAQLNRLVIQISRDFFLKQTIVIKIISFKIEKVEYFTYNFLKM